MENVTVCVHPYKYCDGVRDCPNGEDEPEECGKYLNGVHEQAVNALDP